MWVLTEERMHISVMLVLQQLNKKQNKQQQKQTVL